MMNRMKKKINNKIKSKSKKKLNKNLKLKRLGYLQLK